MRLGFLRRVVLDPGWVGLCPTDTGCCISAVNELDSFSTVIRKIGESGFGRSREREMMEHPVVTRKQKGGRQSLEVFQF